MFEVVLVRLALRIDKDEANKDDGKESRIAGMPRREMFGRRCHDDERDRCCVQPWIRAKGVEVPVEGRLGGWGTRKWRKRVSAVSDRPCFVLTAGLADMLVRRSPRQMLLHSPNSTFHSILVAYTL